MGELTPGDAAMLRRLRRKTPSGAARAMSLPLPDGARFGDGSIDAALNKHGYVGAFTVETDESGRRRAVVTGFDDEKSWRS